MPQRGAKFSVIFFRRQTGKRRQQIRRQRNAEHALRQFHQAHGIVERRDDLRVDPKRDGENQRHINLKRGHTNRSRNHFVNHAAHRFIAPRRDPLVAKAVVPERGQLKRRLRNARRQHADGQRENFLVQFTSHVRREPEHGRNHHQVEHRCAHGRDEEMSTRIEHAHERRGEAYRQHVGKHHAQQPQHEFRFCLE